MPLLVGRYQPLRLAPGGLAGARGRCGHTQGRGAALIGGGVVTHCMTLRGAVVCATPGSTWAESTRVGTGIAYTLCLGGVAMGPRPWERHACARIRCSPADIVASCSSAHCGECRPRGLRKSAHGQAFARYCLHAQSRTSAPPVLQTSGATGLIPASVLSDQLQCAATAANVHKGWLSGSAVFSLPLSRQGGPCRGQGRGAHCISMTPHIAL